MYKESLEKWKHHEDVACLPCENVLMEVEAELAKVLRVQEEVKSLRPPIVLGNILDKAIQATECLKAKFEIAGCCQAQKDVLNEKAKTAEATRLRNSRNFRDRIAEKMTKTGNGNFPLALGKKMAVLLKEWHESGEADYDDSFNGEALPKGCESSNDMFALPLKFGKFPMTEDGPLTWWHGELAKFWDEEYTNVCLDKARSLAEQGLAKKKIQGITVPPAKERGFVWKKNGGSEFGDVMEMKAVIHILQTSFFTCAPDFWPWKGVPMMIKMLQGSCITVVLTPEQILAAKEDVPSWLSKATQNDLADNFVWQLHAGACMWIPFGFMPVFYGAHVQNGVPLITQANARGGGAKKSLPDEFISFSVFFMCMDPGMIQPHDPMLSRIAANLVSASASIPRSVKEHPSMIAYKSKLEA